MKEGSYIYVYNERVGIIPVILTLHRIQSSYQESATFAQPLTTTTITRKLNIAFLGLSVTLLGLSVHYLVSGLADDI
jgi:hypothetical protein